MDLDVRAEKEVFISYSSKDFERVNRIKEILETNGISCWMAPQCIPAGSNYAREIPAAIKNCKVFLLMLTSRSQESQWVPKELSLALSEGKCVLPFMLENCALTEMFNFYLTAEGADGPDSAGMRRRRGKFGRKPVPAYFRCRGLGGCQGQEPAQQRTVHVSHCASETVQGKSQR